MFHSLEADHHFFEYYNPYINKDWKHEYFAYDHFKTAYKTIKAKSHQSNSYDSFVDLQRQCHKEVKKVHRFIVNMMLSIDLDLQTINEMLEAEGYRVKKPSQLRSVMTKKVAESNMMYANEEHVARKSSIVLSAEDVDQVLKDDKYRHDTAQDNATKLRNQLRYCFTQISQPFQRLSTGLRRRQGSGGGEDGTTGTEGTSHHASGRARKGSLDQRAIRDRSMELSLRNVYRTVKKLEQFYHINFFAIRKVSKKIDKLLKIYIEHAVRNRNIASSPTETSSKKLNYDTSGSNKFTEMPVQTWKETKSGRYFYREYVASKHVIEELKDESIALYAKKFRKTYTDLATYELEYMKEKDRTNSSTKLYVGWKFGLIVCMVAWLLVDSYSMDQNNHFDFWAQPGLFVYTTIGNLLLYRLCWAFNILIWSKYDINYISILHLKNIKPNLLHIMDQTTTLLVLYFVNLLVFFRINAYQDASFYITQYPYLSYGCPLLLIAISVLYVMYEYLYLFGGERISIGIFNFRVLRHCLQAPFAEITFRDSFAANVLTSFTRIISDSMYASCWIVSGAFLDTSGDQLHDNFGSSTMHCTSLQMIRVVSFVQMIPLFIRFLQCLRSLKDHHFELYPTAFNPLKYVVSVLVVVLGLQYRDTTGDGISVYYFFIVFSTLFKWWWDVVIDWGLLEVLPSISFADIINAVQTRLQYACGYNRADTSDVDDNEDLDPEEPPVSLAFVESLQLTVTGWMQSTMFLRPSLMYPNSLVYYVCIVLDLVLRFLWILSLLPPDTLPKELVGYQLKFFLGSMEILRRCMWATFRLEHEHLKMLKKNTPGFLSNLVMRKHEDWLLSLGEEGEDNDTMGMQDDTEDQSDKSIIGGQDTVKTNFALTLQSIRELRRSSVKYKQSKGRTPRNSMKKSNVDLNHSNKSEIIEDRQSKPSEEVVSLLNLQEELGWLHRDVDTNLDDATSTVTNIKVMESIPMDDINIMIVEEGEEIKLKARVGVTDPSLTDVDDALNENDVELVQMHRRNSIFDLPPEVLEFSDNQHVDIEVKDVERNIPTDFVHDHLIHTGGDGEVVEETEFGVSSKKSVLDWQ